MELIDIIKSSVVLFIFSLLMVLIISYTLYKIRNQAKTKNLGYFNRTEGKNLRAVSLQDNKSQGILEPVKLKNASIIDSKNRFTVLNKKVQSEQIIALRSINQYNIYKFYEEFNSKKMFKIKPGINTK